MSAEQAHLEATPGQTVGPFFGYALPYDGGPALVPPGSPGAIRLHGRVLDGAGEPVPDALLELWQAAPDGTVARAPGSLRRLVDEPAPFTGWGRAATDGDGHYAFSTLAPGPTSPGAAPFFAITVLARGLLNRLFTRAYLPGADLAAESLLAGLDPERRATLLAAEDPSGLAFDVRLQGPGETVFLTHPRH